MTIQVQALTNTQFVQGLSLIPTHSTPSFVQLVDVVDHYSPSSQVNQSYTFDVALNNFLATFNNSQLPQTADDFFSQFTSYYNNLPGITQPLLSQTNTPLETIFANAYAQMTNAGPQIPGVAPTGTADPVTVAAQSTDWSIISPPPSAASIQSQFNAWFTDFLTNYQYASPGVVGTSAQFLGNMTQSLSTTVSLQSGSALFQPSDVPSQPPNPSIPPAAFSFNSTPINQTLPSYEDIYKQYFPNATPAEFQAAFNDFYQAQIAERGYFLPSQSFGAWAAQTIQQLNAALMGPINLAIDTTSLASLNTDKLLVLNRIYQLIANLLSTLQGIAAVQASRLTILTNWQAAYTASLNQLHVFLSNDGTIAGQGNPSDPNDPHNGDRSDLNNFNSSLRSLMENNRSVIGDDAKALQSNVNQSNDSVSQQANMATAIIQELSTILSSIYR